MFAASERFKKVIAKERSDKEQVNRERELETLKQEVLDMSDKFDYFVCMMLKDKKITPEDISETKKSAVLFVYTFFCKLLKFCLHL